MLARIEAGQRQLVPALLSAQVAHFPDKIIIGSEAEPALQHTADAEAFALTYKEPPCVLQPKPELHKAFLGIFDCNHIQI